MGWDNAIESVLPLQLVLLLLLLRLWTIKRKVSKLMKALNLVFSCLALPGMWMVVAFQMNPRLIPVFAHSKLNCKLRASNKVD